MPKCLPFCGWRYNPKNVEIKEVVAPPYDVVTEEEKRYYKNLSPYNIFHLELPEDINLVKNHVKTWIEKNILIKENGPCLYFYEIEFKHQKKTYIRKGWVLLVKLHRFEEGIILPHEKVYKKVTEERLKLLKTTSFQFSQVFGLYEDPDLNTLQPEKKSLLYEVAHNNEYHKFYKVDFQEEIKKVTSFLRDKKIYIADGHHRYTTALEFKEEMEKIYGKDENKDYNYIAMYLCAVDDPNLLILPTHRVYYLKDVNSLLEKFKSFFEFSKELNLNREILFQDIFSDPKREMIFTFKGKTFLGRIKPYILEKIKNEEPVLSELALYNFLWIAEKVLGITEELLREKGLVEFTADFQKIFEITKVKEGLGIIFPPISKESFKFVTLTKKRMPHKATFFYPKILTGFVLYEITGKSLNFKE